MPRIFKRLVLFTSIAAAFAADKEAPFKAAPVASYQYRQTNSQLTIAADPYLTDEKQKQAFGKVRLTDWDITPILVVMQNDGDKTIRLDRMKLSVSGPDRKTVDATPARDVKYINGPSRPGVVVSPTGKPVPTKMKKNPLSAWEIEGRSFAATMLAPGQSAFGFFYFQTGLHGDSTLLVNGSTEAGSGKELVFFEIPLR